MVYFLELYIYLMNLECFVIHVFRWNGSFWPRLAGTSSLSAPSNTGPVSPHSWAGVLFPDLNIQQVSWGKKKSTRVVIPWPFDSTPCKCSELLLLFGTHTRTHTLSMSMWSPAGPFILCSECVLQLRLWRMRFVDSGGHIAMVGLEQKRVMKKNIHCKSK